jgi:fructokinase
MPRIVVAGEALIDLVPEGTGPLAPLAPQRGGGPYNTAIALGRLGSRTAFLSRVSTDAYGEALLAGLRETGVSTALVQRGPEPTTLAAATVGEDGSASYTFYVEGTADRLFTAPDGLPAQTRAVSFGTCSLVLEPGATAYASVLREASERGLLTALDPNIRIPLITDHAAYRKRFASWLPDVGLLKLSEEDAHWLAEGDPAQAVAEWLAAGVQVVILTHGADGLTAFTRNAGNDAEISNGASHGIIRVPAVTGSVADTIGAGDTVNAALLHWLDTRDALACDALGALTTADWRSALTFAARAAAITCSRPGCNPPYAHELRD